MEIIVVTRFETVLNVVIDEEFFITGRISPIGELSLSLQLKYIITTNMQDKRHAIVKLKEAFTPRDSLGKMGVKKKIKHKIIPDFCSKNSEKLIAKKCLFPHNALLKTA